MRSARVSDFRGVGHRLRPTVPRIPATSLPSPRGTVIAGLTRMRHLTLALPILCLTACGSVTVTPDGGGGSTGSSGSGGSTGAAPARAALPRARTAALAGWRRRRRGTERPAAGGVARGWRGNGGGAGSGTAGGGRHGRRLRPQRRRYPPGPVPSSDNCNTCTCTAGGQIACTARACPPDGGEPGPCILDQSTVRQHGRTHGLRRPRDADAAGRVSLLRSAARDHSDRRLVRAAATDLRPRQRHRRRRHHARHPGRRRAGRAVQTRRPNMPLSSGAMVVRPTPPSSASPVAMAGCSSSADRDPTGSATSCKDIPAGVARLVTQLRGSISSSSPTRAAWRCADAAARPLR